MTCLLFRYNIAECAHHDRCFYTNNTIDISLSTANNTDKRNVGIAWWCCVHVHAHGCWILLATPADAVRHWIGWSNMGVIYINIYFIFDIETFIATTSFEVICVRRQTFLSICMVQYLNILRKRMVGFGRFYFWNYRNKWKRMFPNIFFGNTRFISTEYNRCEHVLWMVDWTHVIHSQCALRFEELKKK